MKPPSAPPSVAAAAPDVSDAASACDAYASLARDKFGGATSISSSSFAAARPPSSVEAAKDPAISAAEEQAAQQRRLEQLWGASAISSADLSDKQTSPGRAARIAESSLSATKALTGYASSLLSRGNASKDTV